MKSTSKPPVPKKPASEKPGGKARKASAAPKAPAGAVEVKPLVPQRVNLTWRERIAKLVLPAQLQGMAFFTGRGELGPGLPVAVTSQSPHRPKGLPTWYVFLDATEHRPAIHFANLSFRPKHAPTGVEWLSFPRPGEKGVELGLSIPLGAGLEVSAVEQEFERMVQQSLFGKEVFVIALGRARTWQSPTAMGVHDPALLEVYDAKTGHMIWRNPYAPSLERAIASVLGSSAPPAPKLAALASLTADLAPAPAALVRQGSNKENPSPSSEDSRVLREFFLEHEGRGLSDDDMISLANNNLGLHPVLIRRALFHLRLGSEEPIGLSRLQTIFEKHADHSLPDAEVIDLAVHVTGIPRRIVAHALMKWRREIAVRQATLHDKQVLLEDLMTQAASCGFIEDEFWEAVQEAIAGTILEGMNREEMNALLAEEIPAPSMRALAPHVDGGSFEPASDELGADQPASAQAAPKKRRGGQSRDQDGPRSRWKRPPASPESVEINSPKWWALNLHPKRQEYQNQVVATIRDATIRAYEQGGAVTPAASNPTLRKALGLPEHSFKEWKVLNDAFRRVILADLITQGEIIAVGRGTRGITYMLSPSKAELLRSVSSKV